MEFEVLNLAHIGRNADDGVTLVDEIDRELGELAKHVIDERFSDSGKLTVTISLERKGEAAIMIDGVVRTKVPARCHKAIVGHVFEGGLQVQKAVQMPMFTPANAGEGES